jgi:hypothetical protein
MATPVVPIGRVRTPSARIGIGMLVTATIVVAVVAVWLIAPRLLSDGTSSNAEPSARAVAAFSEQTGVQVVRVALTGGGGIVDLRYRVVDPDKAQAAHDPAPAILDEDTGTLVDTPFMGHRHGGPVKAGVTYPQLYVNEQGAIEQGDTVSVLVGESRLEHVVVQ